MNKRKRASQQGATVTGAYPLRLAALMQERGHDAGALIQGLGLDVASLARPDSRISLADYARLAGVAMQCAGDEGLGCALAMQTPPTAHGSLGVAMLSSETLADALALSGRFMSLLQQSISFDIAMGADRVQFMPQRNHPHVELALPVRRYMAEALMVGAARTTAWLLGRQYLEGELWFTHARPPYFDVWEDKLPFTRFGTPYNCLSMPLGLLQCRLPLADKITRDRAVAQCEKELSLLDRASPSTVMQVRAHLRDAPKAHFVASAFAQRLHLSERTFKRRLAEEGTSFTALLRDEMFVAACQHLLHSELSIEHIALTLGYTDPANFTRAFRQWSGVSPSDYRAQQRP
ncbi:MAG: AraC family transcriptional regulator [Aquabacterium sp.]